MSRSQTQFVLMVHVAIGTGLAEARYPSDGQRMLRSSSYQAQPGEARNALSRGISHLEREYLKGRAYDPSTDGAPRPRPDLTRLTRSTRSKSAPTSIVGAPRKPNKARQCLAAGIVIGPCIFRYDAVGGGPYSGGTQEVRRFRALMPRCPARPGTFRKVWHARPQRGPRSGLEQPVPDSSSIRGR